MLSTLIALALLVHSPAPQESEVRAKFVELAGTHNDAALRELWKAHRDEILYTLDADLEGSLAAWEKSPDKPDAAAIEALHERALWGARIASEATGDPLFADYASAFVGWNADQKKSFRAGQTAHGRAGKALKAGDHATAAKAARECADLALPLGDWWGYAMGLSAEGFALAASGEHARAQLSLSQARVVYHALGLVGDEYGCTKALAKSWHALKHFERAGAAARAALALAERLGDTRAKAELEKLALEIDAQLKKG